LFGSRGRGYIYTRMGNPTVEALERCVAALEGGHKALACSSGMAAIHTCLVSVLNAGDHVVCSDAVYGPTCTLIETVLSRFGIEATMVDTSNLGAVRSAIRDNTRLVYIETPGNPTLVITDIKAVARIARESGALLVVDNTFMSPVLQQPFRWGADVVIHSLTKFLNGHADVVGGAIVVKEEAAYAQFRKVLNQIGGVLSPFEAFLVHRGIKTLVLRVRRQTDSALKVAHFLAAHPGVEWVRYPGLRDHPQYEIARKQMDGAGALISFGLRGGLEAGRAMMNAVRLCTLAVSLGGVETLIQHPATMTHASMGRIARKRAHITDGLVRLSVGIENVDGIIADLDQALERAQHAQPTPALLRTTPSSPLKKPIVHAARRLGQGTAWGHDGTKPRRQRSNHRCRRPERRINHAKTAQAEAFPSV
jgi:methionine-gamma-lyase